MSLRVALHRPNRAVASTFTDSDGSKHGHVRFTSEDGGEVDFYTTPYAAAALACALNGAFPDARAADEEREGTA